MKKEIEKAIRETLVVDNKQSIHIAVEKIWNLFNVSNCSCISRDTLTPEAKKMFDDIDKALERKK